MNILILGSGGREHAFAWKIAQSPICTNLYVAPGNAGTASSAENISLNPNDFNRVKQTCLDKKVDMVVVGPEEPLVRGIVDFLKKDNETKSIMVIGPDKLGAQLEGSKDFSKTFMKKYGIPTAQSCTVTLEELEIGYSFLEKQKAPFVLKADGLAAGKGVIITSDLDDAKSTLKEMLDGQFGEASTSVVIEEFLDGVELSLFVLTDGSSYKILPEAKDYKRILEGDKGPNTGGMGAISPVPFANRDFLQKVESRIVIPTIEGIKNEGMIYNGFVFIGLMNVNGDPFVIEYNVRMGDPETEVVVPRIKNDIVELLRKTANGQLKDVSLVISEKTAATVVAVSEGYPGKYEKEKEISGLENDVDGIIFHAGTKKENGKTLTNGGRVLAVTSLSSDLFSARKKSYNALEKISWEGMQFRSDIGKDLEDYS